MVCTFIVFKVCVYIHEIIFHDIVYRVISGVTIKITSNDNSKSFENVFPKIGSDLSCLRDPLFAKRVIFVSTRCKLGFSKDKLFCWIFDRLELAIHEEFIVSFVIKFSFSS